MFYFPRRGAGDSAKENSMPHVTYDPDILEQAATAYERDQVQSLPLVPPPSRHGGSRLLAALCALFTPARKSRALRAQQSAPTVRKFELPIDIMARQYPDIYIRVMSGSG
jgi:hypothetical protein